MKVYNLNSTRFKWYFVTINKKFTASIDVKFKNEQILSKLNFVCCGPERSSNNIIFYVPELNLLDYYEKFETSLQDFKLSRSI